MSLIKAKQAVVIYVNCKNRWFDKYQMKPLFEFEKFKYHQPLFELNLWLQEYAYYRARIFKNKKYDMKFNFCS